jgi:hypothetical protein
MNCGKIALANSQNNEEPFLDWLARKAREFGIARTLIPARKAQLYGSPGERAGSRNHTRTRTSPPRSCPGLSCPEPFVIRAEPGDSANRLRVGNAVEKITNPGLRRREHSS